METGRYCAYNLTRNTLLSERVMEVNDALAPEQLLPLLLNGPGIDRHAGLWLKEVAGAIHTPRLFAYEVLYLDQEQRVVEAAAVGPLTEFPAPDETVASVLILADRGLAETGTTAGDQVRICGEAELAVLVRTASQSREIRLEVEPSQRLPNAQSTAEQMFAPEFVFQPFAGSLIHLPEGPTTQAHTSEYFLAFRNTESSFESLTAKEPEAIAASLPEPSFELAEADLAPAQESAEVPNEQQTRKAPGPEVPQFRSPSPIRFFDPATGFEAEPLDEVVADAEERSRPSTQLSPELKDAIWRIDEQLRREKEEQSDARNREKKSKQRKRKLAKQEVTRIFEAPEQRARSQEPVGVEPKAAEMIESPVGSETRKIRLEHLSVEPVAAEAIPVESASHSLPAEPEVERQDLAAAVAASVAAEIVPQLENVIEQPVELAESVPTEPPVLPPPMETAPVSYERIEEQPTAKKEVERRRFVLPPIFERPVTLAGREVEEPITAAEAQVEAPVQKIIEPEIHIQKEPKKEKPEKAPKPIQEKPSIGTRLQRLLTGESSSLSGNRRRGERIIVPGLVAYYWSGGAPKAHEIVNISRSGFYVRTNDIWSPDTLVRMTLQRPKEDEEGQRRSIGVLARVVRVDDNGVGHEFVTIEQLQGLRSFEILPEHGTKRKELQKFLAIK